MRTKKADPEEIFEDYKSGKSIGELCEIYDLSRTSIYRYLREYSEGGEFECEMCEGTFITEHAYLTHKSQAHLDDESERFWDKVRKGNSCWIWTGSRTKQGYGNFHSGDGKPIKSHRYMLTEIKDVDIDGKVVRHKCDNPSCVNPDHLELGDQEQNMSDAVKRDRTASGSKNSQSKLTRSEVKEIKELLDDDVTQKEIAKMFGVTRGCISKISSGKNWTEV